MANKPSEENNDKDDKQQADAPDPAMPPADAAQGLQPPVTLDGKPLLFVAVEGSALMLNACPVAVGWTTTANAPPVSHLVRPPVAWTDKAWDDAHLAELGLSRDDLTTKGAPAVPIAVAAQAAVAGQCLVMQRPGIEKIWLMELLMLQPADICLDTISLTNLALLLADHVGLDEDAFVDVVSERWFRLLLKHHAPDAWITAAPKLIQELLDEAVRRGNVDPQATVALNSQKPASSERTSRTPGKGSGA